MPSTKVHDRITLISAVAIAPLTLAVPSENRWISSTVLTGSHLLSGLLFSCDLDIQAVEYRRWGPLRYLWLPYARMVLHRSWLSHSLVFGPLLRLLYFALAVDLLVLLIALVGYSAGGGLGWLDQWHRFWFDLMRAHPRYFVDVAVGFCIGGALHSIPDWLQTWSRRLV